MATDEKRAARMLEIRRLARARAERGERVYVVLFMFSQIHEWTEIVDAIERGGWELEHWTGLDKGNASGVFRADES